MAIRSLPEYTSGESYVYVEDVESFVKQTFPEIIAVDTETYFVEGKGIAKFIKGAPNNVPFGVSLYFEGKGYWIDKDLAKLKPLLENEAVAKVFHNMKYDIFMLKNIGLEVKGTLHDTMILMQLIDEEHECNTPDGGKKKTKALKHLAYHFLGKQAHELEHMVGDYRKIMAANMGKAKDDVSYKDVNDENFQLMMDYAVKDTEFTYNLFYILYPEMLKQDLQKAYECDIKATLAVIEIERQGFKVDINLMQEDEKKLQKIIDECVKSCHFIAEKEFNIDSDRELVDVFKNLYVDWKWFTDTGEYSTDKKVLKSISANEDYYSDARTVASEVLKYRKASKILSTYITGVYPFIQNGKVHCEYHISPNDYSKGGTTTGRLSSSNPNLQNIPKKPVELGDSVFNVRNYFVADDGYVLVFNDFDQQEYRLLGHYGQDPAFMRFIDEGKDIHKATASIINKVAYDDVTDDMRTKAKTLNFGTVYGLGNAALANSLGYSIDEKRMRNGTRVIYKHYKPWKVPPYSTGVSTEEMLQYCETDEERDGVEYFMSDSVQEAIKFASDFKKTYFKQFAGNKEFIDTCTKAAQDRGYVRTWVGRRRHFKKPRDEGYKAPNAIIQGGCGDILKVKLWELSNFLKNHKSKMVNNVHDEICTMIHVDELYIVDEIKKILEALPFRVPITCGTEFGYRWGSKMDIERNSEGVFILPSQK